MKKLVFFLQCTRAYSLPMSIMAWLIPFSFACFNSDCGKINVMYGLLALVGIVCAHLGANLLDDIIDYKSYLKEKKNNKSLNLKKGKCKFFIEKKLSVKKALFVSGILFLAAVLIGLFFVSIYKLPVLILMAIAGVLCLLYPKSGYLGLSEVIIGLIFSPLLFLGVYYVMTGSISHRLEWMSVSFALVTITLLYTDFFLDYNIDKASGKKTLPVISGSKQNAYFFYIFIVFLIYANIFVGIHAHILPMRYMIIFISLYYALKTAGNLQYYLDKEIKDEKDFLKIMNDVQKFIAVFAFLSVISFYLT